MLRAGTTTETAHNPMYSVDLAQITLDEFAAIIANTDLTPGRRVLKMDLPEVLGRIKQQGVNHLADLQRLLKNKKQYPHLADELQVSTEYLTVLNREINSYVAKPVLLASLDVFSPEELTCLGEAGIKSSKDLYQACLSKAARAELSARLNVPENKIMAALELSDLLRINGVGPVYAFILREMGIHSPTDYLNVESEQILTRFQQINAKKGLTRAKLGLKDVEYCKRFCTKLDAEIEW